MDAEDGVTSSPQVSTYTVYNPDGSVKSTKTENYVSTTYTGNGDAAALAQPGDVIPRDWTSGVGGFFDTAKHALSDAENSILKPLILPGAIAASLLVLLYFGPELKILLKRAVG